MTPIATEAIAKMPKTPQLPEELIQDVMGRIVDKKQAENPLELITDSYRKSPGFRLGANLTLGGLTLTAFTGLAITYACLVGLIALRNPIDSIYNSINQTLNLPAQTALLVATASAPTQQLPTAICENYFAGDLLCAYINQVVKDKTITIDYPVIGHAQITVPDPMNLVSLLQDRMQDWWIWLNSGNGCP